MARQEANGRPIHIVSDSPIFTKFRKRNWLKMDGSPVANKQLYDDIETLEQGLKVRYSYLNLPNENADYAHASVLAEDGLSLPAVKSF